MNFECIRKAIARLISCLCCGRGVAGAAWATVASQYVAVVLLFIALTRQTKDSKGSKGNSWEKSKGSSSSSRPVALELGWFGLPSPRILGEFYDMALSLVLRCVLGMVCPCMVFRFSITLSFSLATLITRWLDVLLITSTSFCSFAEMDWLF